jgi:hypothetical protein
MSIESILGATVVLALVIFVHELGHFLVAKWCDVEVHVFSMGFGPTLLSRRWGETEYRLSAIPFGGYVRMAGEDGADEPLTRPERGFSAKPIRQRAAIVAAGPGVNVLFAFLIFTGTFFFYGENVPVEAPKIGGVIADAPAAKPDCKAATSSSPGRRSGHYVGRPRRPGAPERRAQALARGRPCGPAAHDRGVAQAASRARLPRRSRGDAYMIGIERALEIHPVGFFRSIELGARYTWGFTRLIFERSPGCSRGACPLRTWAARS